MMGISGKIMLSTLPRHLLDLEEQDRIIVIYPSPSLSPSFPLFPPPIRPPGLPQVDFIQGLPGGQGGVKIAILEEISEYLNVALTRSCKEKCPKTRGV